MNFNNSFKPSPEQEAIINLETGKHLVLAPPGTGKTEMLALRVQKALSINIRPEQIICLTFTNRAAKGMKERVEQKFPRSNVFIGNIHNYCIRFMFANRLIPQSAAVMDEAEADLLMEEASWQFDYRGPVAELLKLSTYLKQTSLGFPAEILHKPSERTLKDPQAAQVCYLYEKNKSALQLLDYDDLLTETYFTLSKKKQSLRFSNYNWVMVDEVQDLNALQWEIIKLISAKDAHIMFFGDYEQAIFSFMGARLDMLRKIARDCEIHNLQKNFRSPSYLLDLFKEYAVENLNIIWKAPPLAAENKEAGPGDLRIYPVKGEDFAQARFVANLLKEGEAAAGEKSAVLVRTNKQADLLSSVMDKINLSHFRVSGFDLFKRRLTKDTVAFLTSLYNSWDRLAWARLYWIFGGLRQLNDARTLMVELYRHGLTPNEFLTGRSFTNSLLREFLNHKVSGRIVVFDTETTGLDTSAEDIVQIAATEIIDGKPARELEIFLKTEKSLEQTVKIHGITKEFLELNGMRREEGLRKFVEFLGNDIAVAHNITYDRNILKSNLEKEGLNSDITLNDKWLDTLSISRRYLPELTSYRLEEVIKKLGLPAVNFHNAKDDVQATVNLVLKIWEGLPEAVRKQDEFIPKKRKTFENMRANFGEVYTNALAQGESNARVSEFVSEFIGFLSGYKTYGLDADSLTQIGKLIAHFDAKAPEGNLMDVIKKIIPEYRTYKESDLLLGTEKIVISTVHKAKGLEFDNVVIPYCTDGVYPMSFRGEQGDTEEEARLLYVALTRSKRRIILTYNNIKDLSRFIQPVKHYFEEVTA